MSATTDTPLIPCSDYILRAFPKPCRPNKTHACRLCGQIIQAKEPCCRWTGFYEGRFTSHAHPECYDATKRWDEGDWESCHSGDEERPEERMYWPDAEINHNNIK